MCIQNRYKYSYNINCTRKTSTCILQIYNEFLVAISFKPWKLSNMKAYVFFWEKYNLVI